MFAILIWFGSVAFHSNFYCDTNYVKLKHFTAMLSSYLYLFPFDTCLHRHQYSTPHGIQIILQLKHITTKYPTIHPVHWLGCAVVRIIFVFFFFFVQIALTNNWRTHHKRTWHSIFTENVHICFDLMFMSLFEKNSQLKIRNELQILAIINCHHITSHQNAVSHCKRQINW